MSKITLYDWEQVAIHLRIQCAKVTGIIFIALAVAGLLEVVTKITFTRFRTSCTSIVFVGAIMRKSSPSCCTQGVCVVVLTRLASAFGCAWHASIQRSSAL